MGRKTNMPRPPDILRKGGGHRDRRKDAYLKAWAEEELETYDRANLIRGLMDNQTQQEDTDA